MSFVQHIMLVYISRWCMYSQIIYFNCFFMEHLKNRFLFARFICSKYIYYSLSFPPTSLLAWCQSSAGLWGCQSVFNRSSQLNPEVSKWFNLPGEEQDRSVWNRILNCDCFWWEWVWNRHFQHIYGGKKTTLLWQVNFKRWKEVDSCLKVFMTSMLCVNYR